MVKIYLTSGIAAPTHSAIVGSVVLYKRPIFFNHMVYHKWKIHSKVARPWKKGQQPKVISSKSYNTPSTRCFQKDGESQINPPSRLSGHVHGHLSSVPHSHWHTRNHKPQRLSS